MSTMLMATDYSRPMQHLFEQEMQVGSVHSVFGRAMNIEFGDTLLSVLSDELPHMPNSVRLPARQAERLFARVRPGMAAFVGSDVRLSRGGGRGCGEGTPSYSSCQRAAALINRQSETTLSRLRFAPSDCKECASLRQDARKLGPPVGSGTSTKNGDGITNSGRPKGPLPASPATPAPTTRCLSIPVCDWWIALPPMAAWEPRPQFGLLAWQRDRVARHTDMLARYLAEVAQKEGLAALVGPLLLDRASRMTVLTQRALPMLRLLVQAGVERKREGIEGVAMGLLGLGPGLTPSGDDVLAGFVAAMVLLSARLSVDGLSREEVGLWIAALAPSRTTRLSAALLAYAARGEVAEQLGDLLMALASPIEATKAVLHAADGLLQFGATSGGDTLLGVLLGLRVLEHSLHPD